MVAETVTVTVAVAMAVLGGLRPSYAAEDRLEAHTVVWTTPSLDARGSMPIGNGGIGVNARVEGGDLLLHRQKRCLG